jgi:23S rRNA pseudouridine955/2504/2580 synthase
MKEVTVSRDQAGQRLDKYLQRILPQAGKSFLYKMLRKKNILFNQGKAQGNELLTVGDQLTFFFSDETYAKFAGEGETAHSRISLLEESQSTYHALGRIPVLWEDADVLILNKPLGILSQKSTPHDKSLNEWLIGYLLEKGDITAESLTHFRPSICNRLDRNTPGLLLCGKTLIGSRELSSLLRDRLLHKYYQALVLGKVEQHGELKGYLTKDPKTNKVTVHAGTYPTEGTAFSAAKGTYPAEDYIYTEFSPLQYFSDDKTGTAYTLLEVQLHTGKSHQIRAHLASVGHPIIGDPKYGDRYQNDLFRQRAGLHSQLLYACRLEFPTLETYLTSLNGKTITAPMPEPFQAALSLLRNDLH